MARQERSAGIVVFLQELPADARRYLLLNYGRYWDLPKGHVEKGESDLAAAVRELKEETGIENATVIDGFRREIGYWFRQQPQGLIHKKVIFFLARAKSDRVKISHEHVGHVLLPFAEALARAGFENTRGVLRDAEAYLAQERVT